MTNRMYDNEFARDLRAQHGHRMNWPDGSDRQRGGGRRGRDGDGRRGRDGDGRNDGGRAGDGPDAFEAGGFGPGGFGPGGPRGRRGRARRGDVRQASLLLLSETPMNGYQIMQELSDRSQGAWSASSGAIYPALSQLEDEGLIEAITTDGRKAYRLTEAGTETVAAWGDRPRPWERAAAEDSARGSHALRGAMAQLAMATKAVAQTGDAELASEAAAAIEAARRDIYRLLADGPQQPGTEKMGTEDADSAS